MVAELFPACDFLEKDAMGRRAFDIIADHAPLSGWQIALQCLQADPQDMQTKLAELTRLGLVNYVGSADAVLDGIYHLAKLGFLVRSMIASNTF